MYVFCIAIAGHYDVYVHVAVLHPFSIISVNYNMKSSSALASAIKSAR